jgi:uncharacterized membrane protein
MRTERRPENFSLRERPGHITEARVVLDAPPADVYAVATDYARWPQILHDVESMKVEGGGRRDAKVRFRSAALREYEVAVQFDNIENRIIRFHSVDAPRGARASGTYVLEPIDGGSRTRLVATFYLDVGGVAGVFVSDRSLRSMREAKLRADLADLVERMRVHYSDSSF